MDRYPRAAALRVQAYTAGYMQAHMQRGEPARSAEEFREFRVSLSLSLSL